MVVRSIFRARECVKAVLELLVREWRGLSPHDGTSVPGDGFRWNEEDMRKG